MAKYISLRVEPDGGTAFDYLINVEDVINIDIDNAGIYLKSGISLGFPLDTDGDTDADTQNMYAFIRNLLLEAKQRSGNAYIVAAEDGPFTITDFS